MKHYSNLPKGTILVKYCDLDNDTSKSIAISEILHSEEIYFERYKNYYIETIKNNIHSNINNRSTYKSLLRNREKIKKLKQNFSYLERYIIENSCDFLPNGEYIYYSYRLF